MFCTRCGQSLEKENTFCTSCGAPVTSQASEPQERAGQGGVENHAEFGDFGSHKGPPEPSSKGLHILLTVIIGVIIIAGAGTAGILIALHHGGTSAAEANLTPTTLPTDGLSSPTTLDETVASATTTTEDSFATTTTMSSTDDWPMGTSGWTAIVYSFAASDSGSEARARTLANTISSGQSIECGVLNSSNHSSLNAGYWATFSGTFATKDEATARCNLLKAAGYSSTYPRYVSP